MIHFKDILLEAMKPSVAAAIFAKYGVRNASVLDKTQLRKYYLALSKKYYPRIEGADNEIMRTINAAYDVLKKSAKEVPDIELKPEDKIVNIEFRNGATEEVLDSGQCNRMEFLEILKKLKEEMVSVKVEPPINYDRIEDRWLVSAIMIYIEADEFYTTAPYLEPLFKH